MKLTIERAALLKTLAHVQSVVERRNTIPILSNVLLEAGDGALSLTATDMDLTIVDSVAAEVAQGGATTVAAHTFYDIVRKLPDGAQVAISATGDGGQIRIEAGRSVFTLATLPKEDFPVSGPADLPHSFSLQPGELRNLIDRTRFAISTEETRYYLNGIYLHATESNGIPVLRAVATDGHRLARFEMPLPEGAAGMPGVIVPRKTVGELRKLIDESDQPIKLSLSDTRIHFAFDSTALDSKLIDGTFPDYQRVIPVGNDKVIELDCRSFAEAVDRVSTISSEKSRAVKLIIENGGITLSANSPENGTATEAVEITYGGPEIEIGFNSRYLLDIAHQIESGEAEIAFADAASPTIVRDRTDSSALYVLMPMRV
jgi:DNA polymerase-3 subunit beta